MRGKRIGEIYQNNHANLERQVVFGILTMSNKVVFQDDVITIAFKLYVTA